MASGYYVGQCKFRAFPSSQKALPDGADLEKLPFTGRRVHQLINL